MAPLNSSSVLQAPLHGEADGQENVREGDVLQKQLLSGCCEVFWMSDSIEFDITGLANVENLNHSV